VVAAEERAEQAGSEQYHENHMGAIFKEGFSFSGYERDLLELNLGDGRYLDISGVSGVDSLSDGRGSVFADLDNDGDTDIFLTTVQGEAHYLFRNNVGAQNRFLRVELEGADSGRDAFGSVVRVRTSSGVRTKLKAGGSGYLSQHDPRLLFGLGDDEHVEWIEVVWPGGAVQRLDGAPAGSTIRIVEGADGYTEVAERRFDLVDPLTRDEAMLVGLGIRMGEPFPDLALRTDSGDETSLRGLLRPGRQTLVNVWATWCVPCAKEMPELQKLYPGLQRAGVDLLGVSIDLDTLDQVPEYIRQRDIDYPIFTTDEAALDALYPTGQATVPLTVLLDGDARVLDVHSGWSEQARLAFEALTSN
jgi:peroxiredoxin